MSRPALRLQLMLLGDSKWVCSLHLHMECQPLQGPSNLRSRMASATLAWAHRRAWTKFQSTAQRLPLTFRDQPPTRCKS